MEQTSQCMPEVVFIASEIYPFSKSGGLADVMGILPLTLHRMGLPVAVFTPFYGRIATSKYQMRLIYENCPVGYPWPDSCADIYVADYEGMPVFFIDRAEYFDRRSYYCTPKYDYFDNCERFIFFNRACLSAMRCLKMPPKVIHAHDWHASLSPAFAYFWRQTDTFWQSTSSVMTIHNLAFQGRFSHRLFWNCGLPYEAWNMNGVEYYDSFNLLKGGIAYADLITTVSPTYAEEIVTPEFGCGLEGILQSRSDRLSGILNGADYEVWSPDEDRYLEAPYSYQDVSGKQKCKMKVLEEFDMDMSLEHKPVLGFIGRLREQKGIDLLLQIMPDLMQRDVGIIVLGEGDPRFEAWLMELVESYHGRIGAYVGYTEEISHKIQAACDIFLMPSRYEPCGLTQMYSLRYGTPPVATAVGGLLDTIVPYPDEKATGFIFPYSDSVHFMQGIDQALDVWYCPDEWAQLRARAMQADFSWQKAGHEYLRLYEQLGVKVD